MDPELQKYVKLLVKLTMIVLFLVAIYLLFTYVFPIAGKVLSYIPVLFLPFIIAVLMAVISEPVVNIFEKKLYLNRSLSVGISLTLILAGFLYIISLIITRAISEISRLYPLVVSYSSQVTSTFLSAITDFRLFFLQLNLPQEVQAAIQDNLQETTKVLSGLMANSVDFLVGILVMLPGIFIFLIISTVATFFIIKDRASIRSFVLHFIPEQIRSETRSVVGELFKAFIGFIKAYSILISITAIITMISLKILGFDYILTIGIVVGLLDILPVLGPGTLFIPWIIWEFLVGKAGTGFSLLAVYIIISAVRQFLEPKIIGDNIGLHPLATLISLYAGLKLGGVPGMILGPITLVILISCYKAGLFKWVNWGNVE
ncbi:MAG: sporulation integral membrane protein YtvI [Syntrophomonadaceae bacterium]|nr:sporulation integral membrane protein YtvI [Syntrophomonadaceae bacterium]